MRRDASGEGAPARERWLTELADALQRAQEILWDCEKAGLRSPEVGALYARIESIHADVRMLQAQALNARRDETDPKRTHLPPWRKASD